MRYVCPKLDAWVELYERINEALKRCCEPDIPPPPAPPTFEEWSSFSDDEKEIHWMLLFGWLEARQAESLADFSDEEWYITGAQYINDDGSFKHFPFPRDPLP